MRFLVFWTHARGNAVTSPLRLFHLPRRSRQYWRRLAGLACLAILVAGLGVPVALGAATTVTLLYAPCGEVGASPGDFGLAWEDVALQASAGGQFRGYLIPGTNGAVILMPPTTNDGRGSRLDMAALFAQHGYAVLTFESRRCAGMGPLSLGYRETDEVGDALTYVTQRAGIDPGRVGIYGFSSAGATAIMAAARFPGIRAVVAEGGYGDFAENAIGRRSDTIFEAIYKWSLGASYRVITGLDINRLSPLDVIGSIAPRPILLIYGTREQSLAGGRQQAAAAGPGAELWVVEGAGHGTYRDAAPGEYERRVIAFFDRALLAGLEQTE